MAAAIFFIAMEQPALANINCEPLGLSRVELSKLSQNDFSAVSEEQIPSFLDVVPACLDSLDLFYRDRIAYEGTASLLRRDRALEALPVVAMRKLKRRLIQALQTDSPDPDGVIKPFAALILAEIARTDRIHPWLNPDERIELLATSGRYLNTLDDYRAFEDQVGFRHGVAHAADLVLQLALNPSIESVQLVSQVPAINSKIAPQGGVAYTTGEPGRLARAMLYLIQRSSDSAELSDAIKNLLTQLADPAPFPDWSTVFKSERGLIFRHNRRAFAEAMYIQLAPFREHEMVIPFFTTLQESLAEIP